MLPKKWGQGQILAFSALDGESLFSDDFTGTLAGDKIGVIFHTLCRRTIFFGEINTSAPEFKCIASDMIMLGAHGKTFSMIFAQRHLVVGETNGIADVFVSLDGKCEITQKGDAEIHNTCDGEYTALLKRNGRFAFAYGKSEAEAINLCEKGIARDIAAEAVKTIEKEDWQLALEFLRKKRYTVGDDRAAAAMARYGFSHDAVRRALAAFSEEQNND
jgi:hypothetical protein